MKKVSNKSKKINALKYQGRDWDKDFYRDNVYSDIAINKYLADLKIKSDEGRSEVTDSILRAAMYYETVKRSHIESYEPVGKVEKNIEALITPLERVIKNLEKMNGTGYMAIIRAFKNINIEMPCSSKEELFINALFPNGKDKALFNPDGLVSFLKTYKKSCERALDSGVSNNVAKKGFALETWLFNLREAWTTYSEIEFTEGHYYTGKGYLTDAVYILEDIMRPLDSSIKRNTIGNKLRELNEEAIE